MELEIGDVVEVVFLLGYSNKTASVFGEVLGNKNNKVRLSIWEAPPRFSGYDEINIDKHKIVGVSHGTTVELDELHEVTEDLPH